MNEKTGTCLAQWAFNVAFTIFGGACSLHEPQVSEAPPTFAIIGGATQSGYPEVGALAQVVFGNYTGSFCTATIVAPSFALTAAHCLFANEEGGQALSPSPETTRLYIGDDARPTGAPALEPPSAGTLHEIAAFYPHPMYKTGSNLYDIALVRLVEPLNDIVPATINTEPLAPEVIDRQATFVGFGFSFVDENGNNGTGLGVKRSADIGLDYFWDDVITTLPAAPGICYGDSGGPSFLDGVVIGVNAATVEPDCLGGAILSRVDYYAPWIEEVISGMATSCLTDGSLCKCEEACQPDGSCNDAVCDLLSCSEAYDCMVECAEDDGACQIQCFASANAAAQEALELMLACFQYFCAEVTGPPQQQCVLDNCGDPIAVCGLDAPGMNCDLRGGDCETGKACAPVPGGVPRCKDSDDRALGEECDAATLDPLACSDGERCTQADPDGTAVCLPYCLGDADCEDSSECESIGESNGVSYGVCIPPSAAESDSSGTDSAPMDSTDSQETVEGTGDSETLKSSNECASDSENSPSDVAETTDFGSDRNSPETGSNSNGCSFSPRACQKLAILAALVVPIFF